jgi:UDP-N-acetylglucosamine--N-acetylmuramyl-(pentapeptide) pyrophosphoryl-undecaprenol N-acetylglucosamine transferase
MKQLETTPESLAALLRSLTRGKLAAMAAAARGLGKPDATRRCADLCMEVARAA